MFIPSTRINPTNPYECLHRVLTPNGVTNHTIGQLVLDRFLVERFGTRNKRQLEGQWLQTLNDLPKARVIILGVPSDTGALRGRGAMFAPMAIRRQFLAKPHFYEEMSSKGVIDLGDVLCHPSLLDDTMLNEATIRDLRQRRWGNVGALLSLPVSPHSLLSCAIECILEINPHVHIMILGGDHSIAGPAIRALYEGEQDFGVVHVDAHCDGSQDEGISAPYETWSVDVETRLQDPMKLQQVGIRDDQPMTPDRFPRYRRDHDEYPGSMHMAYEVIYEGAEVVIERVVRNLQTAGVRRLYFTHDIDGTDPSFAMATGCPALQGLPPQFVGALVSALGKNFELIGADLMEVAPCHSRGIEGEPHRTLQLAAYYVFESIRAMIPKEASLENPFTIPEPHPLTPQQFVDVLK